jgi:diguanylate cyclase (GGDEF)-like protein/PAS domain S-box-containing protein
MMRPFLLRRSLRSFDFARVAANHRSAGVCVVDHQGRFCLVNPVAERLLGWAEAELQGRDLHTTIHRCQHAEGSAACSLYQAVLGKTLFKRDDDVLRRKDGNTVPVSYLSSPLILEGQVAGTLIVFHDTTQQRQEMQELREREERYRCLAEASPEPMWLTDVYGYITMANARAAEMFGYGAWGELIHINALELFALNDRPGAVRARKRAINESDSTTEECHLLKGADGGNSSRAPFPAEVTISPLLTEDGKIKALLYAAHDLTERYASEEQHIGTRQATLPMEQAVALTLSGSTLLGDTIPRLLQTICECASWDVGAYWQVDTYEQVLRCGSFWHAADLPVNAFEALCHQLSFAPGVDLPGRAWRQNDPVWVSDVVGDTDMLRALVASKEGLHGAFCFPISAGGALQGVMEFFSRAPREPDPELLKAADSASAQIGWFLERHQAERTLRHQALHDGLTGLPNRTLLLDRLQRSLFVSRETGKPATLFLIDLDRFKQVNDTNGHEIGDGLLLQVARRIHDVLRDSDTIARLGGDEFAVLLPSTPLAGATVVAEKIVAALREPFTIEGIHLDMGGSIGIALYPEHGKEASHLLRAADAAMYVAKRNRIGYAVYSTEQGEQNSLLLPLSLDASSH